MSASEEITSEQVNDYELPAHIVALIHEGVYEEEKNFKWTGQDITCREIIDFVRRACRGVREKLVKDRHELIDKSTRRNLSLLRKTREEFNNCWLPTRKVTEEMKMQLVNLMLTTFPVPPMTEGEKMINHRLCELGDYFWSIYEGLRYDGVKPLEVKYRELIPDKYQGIITSYLAGG